MKNYKTPKDMIAGSVFTNRSGCKLVIEKYISWKEVYVVFPATGYRKSFQATHIRRGSAMDKLNPSICGVGFVGVGQEKAKVGRRNTDAYNRWSNMIMRCYSEKFHKNNPSYKGCEVHVDWHNFQNFAKWYNDNHPNDGKQYHLDKDSIVPGNKVYSESNCKFITPADNSRIAHEKSYKIRNPDGEVLSITNLSEYCLANNIKRSGLSMLVCGKLKSYKGWTMP